MDPKQEALEQKMNSMVRALDLHLEELYGDAYPLHPNRRVSGFGSNPSFDGLFSTTIAFTPGYGSRYGRGYVVKVDIRTLLPVSLAFREEVEMSSCEFIKEYLPKYLPGRRVEIVKDGDVLKLVGDFSL